jgi:hypothetical protein
VYLLQDIDGSWICYADDDSKILHTCEGRTKNNIRLGNIFEIGSCSRRIVYKALGKWGDFGFGFKAWEAFYVGRAGESYIKDILYKKRGFKIIVKQKDVTFLGFTGRIDGLILINNKVNLLECKTIPDPSKYKAFVESKLQQEHPSYYAQIQAYMAATKTEKCLLIILGDDPDAWNEIYIPLDIAAVSELRQKVATVKEAFIKAELPKGDPYVHPVLECDYCPYRSYCRI